LGVEESIRKFAKQDQDRTWIPGILTLPEGMIHMVEDHLGKPMWSYAPMKEIPEEEQKDYPDPDGGYYQKRYDTENQIPFENFYDCIEALNRIKIMKECLDYSIIGAKSVAIQRYRVPTSSRAPSLSSNTLLSKLRIKNQLY
jgi:hypothetical protein